jgi:hypothetical protein
MIINFREAAGMRCRDQLFRFGLRLSLEPTAEAVRQPNYAERQRHGAAPDRACRISLGLARVNCPRDDQA